MRKIFTPGNVDYYLQAFKEFEKNLNGQAKSDVHKIRQAAIHNFIDLGYPTTKNEEWKYTDISNLAKTDFRPTINFRKSILKPHDIHRFFYSDLDCYRMVFLNGGYAPELSDTGSFPTGAEIKSLNLALTENPELIGSHLSNYAKFDKESFTALNTAFIQDGVFMDIPPGMILDKPAHLLYLTTAEATHLLAQPRNLIIAGENTQIKVIETYAGLSKNMYFNNSVSEFILKPNARVEHAKIQLESEQAYHIATTQVHQERDSNYESHAFSFGASLVRNNINIQLNAPGCECSLNGLYTANQQQHVDNHTAIDHFQPNCNSHELYKGVLDGKASGVFNGKIYVHKDAQKTNAIQQNNCILLSDNATIDSKPQLEIFADDVKCTHGATVGQLDEDAFFYLRSRGIEEIKARNLLIYAFASDVMNRINITAVKEKVADLFTEKLHTIRPM